MKDARVTVKDYQSEHTCSAVSAVVQGSLGHKLRATYDELLRQPLPDDIANLLEAIEQKERLR